jgi:8-oxo-dGTP pyrophosphatase MutT (NUDIX family)
MRYEEFLNRLKEAIERDTKRGAAVRVTVKDEVDESFIGADTKVEYELNVAAGVICKMNEDGRKQILLIQRAADDHWPLYWEFPRGKCDKPIGEPLEKCAIREIKEETNLDVTPIMEIDTLEYTADEGKRKSTCHNFLCRMKNPNQKVVLSSEHADFKWISEVGEAEMLVLPDQKKTIEKVLNQDRTIVSYPDNVFTKNNEVEE